MHDTSLRSPSSKANGAASHAQGDMRALIKDAQTLLTAAAALTGEKAEEMRGKGMQMLDTALGKAHDIQDVALDRGRKLAKSGDAYVHENPWRTVAAAAGIGLLLGVLLGRK